MRWNYKSPSELLQAQRETGKSYWDLVGKPLTPNTGYNLNNPHAAEESEYNKWYNGSKLSDEDSEKLQQLLEEYDKDIKSNSNSLPSYKGGKDKFTTFVERMGPKVYRQLHKQGIYNPYIYDNMMRQLAWESDYGTSPLAISNHNYGGVKSSNTEYAKYKDDDAFADYYVSLIRRKYPQAVKAKDAKSYARELKKVGYYEDSLQNYSQKLSSMSSVSRAAKLHMHTNPKQYEVEMLLDDLKKQSVQQPVSTRVEPPINKEPINKEPFVNTPIPTKAPLITRPEYLESNSLIKKSFEQNMNNMLYGREFQFNLPGFESGKDDNSSPTYPFKRGRMPAHPRNREKDPEAFDAAQQWEADMQQLRQQEEEQNKAYVEEKLKRNTKAAEEFNRRKDTVMSALSDIANSAPFTGSEVNKAAEVQRQEKLDKWHDTQKAIDATMTAGELAAAGYGVARGLTHFNRLLARRAAQSIGQTETPNLVRWNNRVAAIDKPQIAMNVIGGGIDAYQFATADNSFDGWENGMETGANIAGIFGGTNKFKMDAILDGLGYGAAAWDIVKHLPPLSGALENIRQQSINKKASRGSTHKGNAKK